jgi:hypothetical protein
LTKSLATEYGVDVQFTGIGNTGQIVFVFDGEDFMPSAIVAKTRELARLHPDAIRVLVDLALPDPRYVAACLSLGREDKLRRHKP